jgi:hypothetical protein
MRRATLVLITCFLALTPTALAEDGCFNCEDEIIASPTQWNTSRCVQVRPDSWGQGNYCEVMTRTTGEVEYQYCRILGNSCFYIEVGSVMQIEESSTDRREIASNKKVARYF